MHSAAVAPCYHFACKQCWDQLLAAASGGGVHSVCPMCKAPVSRRSVQECEAYNAMTRELQKAIPALAAKAEYARIGRYYATESMLVWDPARHRYDADATPSTGSDTLFSHYEALLRS